MSLTIATDPKRTLHRLGERLARVLTDYHQGYLSVALVIVVLCVPLANQLELDWRIEGLFPPGDSSVASYQRLQERFGGNQIVLAVYRDPQLWDASGSGLERLAQISQSLAAVDGVASVLSLAELHSILEKLRGPSQLLNIRGDRPPPLLDPDDALAQAMLAVFEGYTHKRESQLTSIACILSADREDRDEQQASAQGAKQKNSPLSHDPTLEGLRQVMSNLPAPASEGFITGEPVLVSEGFRLVQRDGWRLGVISSILVSIVLLICFRSVRWTLIPLAVVHWSLIVTRAMLVALQIDLTMISSTLTAIVTVIGVATTIHLLLGFQQQRRSGASREQAMRQSLGQLIAPITWACVTDATGFLALIAASVGPIRDFGLMMSVGSMVVLVAILVLVPGLALIGSWDNDPRTPQIDLLVRLWLRRLLQFCLAHRLAGVSTLMALAAFGIAGSVMMRVETDYTKNFSSASPLVRGYEVIERELGGAGVWDVMLPAPGSISVEYLTQVIELENELRLLRVTDGEQELRLTKVLSIADAELASRASPLLSALPVSARLQGMRAAMPDFSKLLLTGNSVFDGQDQSGVRWLRIMLRSQERVGAVAKQELVAAVVDTVIRFTQSETWRAQFSTPPPSAEVAGYSIMLGRLVSSVLSDQWKCFLRLAPNGTHFVLGL
jgi:predicted RND superfamily exporter protein